MFIFILVKFGRKGAYFYNTNKLQMDFVIVMA